MISSGLENMKHLKLTAWFLHTILGFLAYKAQAHLIRADSGSLVLSTFKSVDRNFFFGERVVVGVKVLILLY